MRINELTNYFRSNYNYTFYSNDFPAVEDKNIGIVRVFPRPTENDQVNYLNIQVLIRNEEEQEAESISWNIYEDLRIKTRFQIGSTFVISCFMNQPEFIPSPERDSFLYSINARLITDQ